MCRHSSAVLKGGQEPPPVAIATCPLPLSKEADGRPHLTSEALLIQLSENSYRGQNPRLKTV